MPLITSDPVGWTRSSLGTVPRLVATSLAFVALTLWLISMENPVTTRLLVGILLVNLLCCFYALWRLQRSLGNALSRARDAV